MRIQSLVDTAAQAVNTAIARGANSYPSVDMARDGYVIEPAFLPAVDAESILQDVERFADRAVRETGVPGSKVTDRSNSQRRDLNVRVLDGAQHLSPVIQRLVESGRIEETMTRLTGHAMAIERLTVQIDWPDTETKRGLHVDSHWPPTYKTFIYLTSVTGPENGPFSVVPGSHRHRVKKVKAIAGDYLHHRSRTDLDFEYSLDDARCLLGTPGTAIFADQRLAHAGWPGHTTGTRFMIVAYLYESGK
ncbi:MAG TPA: phytanoyl-CoA dioxygenase family protein [Propionibacteriaceae bacterium]|nr:phytanoyl-CoA dioxygenase family protein [Propionibacteriaceae bacterium]